MPRTGLASLALRNLASKISLPSNNSLPSRSFYLRAPALWYQVHTQCVISIGSRVAYAIQYDGWTFRPLAPVLVEFVGRSSKFCFVICFYPTALSPSFPPFPLLPKIHSNDYHVLQKHSVYQLVGKHPQLGSQTKIALKTRDVRLLKILTFLVFYNDNQIRVCFYHLHHRSIPTSPFRLRHGEHLTQNVTRTLIEENMSTR